MIKLEKLASFATQKGHGLLFPPEAKDISVTNLYSMQVQGQCNRMYVFSIIYSFGNHSFKKDFVLRTCIGEAEERMAREYRALMTLKAEGIPVPIAILLELDPKTIGAPFMIMEKIVGVSISNFLKDKENALMIVDMLARLMSSVHRIDPAILFGSDASGNGLGRTIEFRENVLSDLRSLINIGYITSLSPFIRRKYLSALMELEKAEIRCSPNTIIHADFGPDHVLSSDKGPIIIDWEGIRIGDPAYDVGWVYHVIRLEGQIMIDHKFVKASKQRRFDFNIGEEFVKCYERYAGSVPVNLEFYKNLAALKLAATLDLNVRPGLFSLSRAYRLRPKEILSQTIFAYDAIKSFKRDCESFLQKRNILQAN